MLFVLWHLTATFADVPKGLLNVQLYNCTTLWLQRFRRKAAFGNSLLGFCFRIAMPQPQSQGSWKSLPCSTCRVNSSPRFTTECIGIVECSWVLPHGTLPESKLCTFSSWNLGPFGSILIFQHHSNTWVFPKIHNGTPKSSIKKSGSVPLFSPSILGGLFSPYFWKHPHSNTIGAAMMATKARRPIRWAVQLCGVFVIDAKKPWSSTSRLLDRKVWRFHLLDVSKNRAKKPQIIHVLSFVHRVFHDFHQPFWGGFPPIFGDSTLLNNVEGDGILMMLRSFFQKKGGLWLCLVPWCVCVCDFRDSHWMSLV